MICTLLALSLLAQPVQVELHYMPPGEKVYLSSAGRWGRGFDLEGYKTLLKMDNELHIAKKQLKLFGDLELHWDDLIGQKDTVILSLEDDVKKYKGRSERLDGKLKKCEEDLVETSGGPVWPYILAAGGAVAGLIGVTWGLAQSL